MEQELIYIIKEYSYKTKDTLLLKYAFKYKEQAIKFIENKLTEKEKISNEEQKRAGLIYWAEFRTKDYLYTIDQLEIYK